jgi:hypothetical protein
VSASPLAVVDHEVSADFANFLVIHAKIRDVDAHAQVQNDRTSVGDQVSCNFMKLNFYFLNFLNYFISIFTFCKTIYFYGKLFIYVFY